MLNRFPAAGCLIVLGLQACGPAGKDAQAVDHAIKDLGPAQVFGKSDTIADIVDLAVLSDGTVWVLNSREPYLVKFGPQGNLERAWGARGAGPGEFQYPLNLVTPDGNKEVWVYDPANDGFIDLSPGNTPPKISLGLSKSAGVDAGFRPLTMGFGTEGMWAATTDSGVLLARSPENRDGIGAYQAEVVELRRDGSITPRFRFAGHLGDPAKNYPGATHFLPVPLWTACPDRSVSLYDPTANVVRRFDPKGEAIDSVILPKPRNVEVTSDRMYTLVRGILLRKAPPDIANDTGKFRALFQQEWDTRLARQSSKVFPEYFDLQCDRSNRLWIQPFNIEAGDYGRGPVWYHLARNEPPTAIRLPRNFRPMAFAADRVWGVARDENDVPSVAWIKLP